MDRFRAAIDELVDKVKEAINGEPKSPVEILLDQYLSLDEEIVSFSPKNCTTVAIPTAVMNDFAARTKNIVDYPFIMERVWEILVDHQHDPTLMKKALNLLLYLLVNGAIQVLKDCQDSPRMTFLSSLTEDYNRYEFEQYKFSQHLDVGAGVRKTAAEIYHLLTNERELFHARRQAELLHQKLSDRGLRSSPSSSLTSSTLHDVRPPRYTDSNTASEDIGLKIITHPDEMFEQPPPRPMQTNFPSSVNPRHENTSTKGDHSDRPPGTTRGRSRKEKRSDSTRNEKSRQQTSNPVVESVDLLGLEALGLESLSSMPLQSHAKPPLHRTQSARMGPPRAYTATI